MLRILAVSGALLFSAACTTTLKVAELDAETGRFDTSTAVAPEEIKVSEKFAVTDTKNLLFIRNNFDDVADVGEYFEGSIQKFGFFDQVMRKDDFERFLISENLQDEIGDVSGFASLSKAADRVGDFLFADLQLELGAGYQVGLKMNVYDARTAKEVFAIDRTITNWGGLDGPLFQPVLNSFFDWVDENRDTVSEVEAVEAETAAVEEPVEEAVSEPVEEVVSEEPSASEEEIVSDVEAETEEETAPTETTEADTEDVLEALND